jgi:hypothetical protein
VDEELDELEQLADKLFSGEKVKVTVDQAVAMAAGFANVIDEMADERARIGARQGMPVVCARGCNGCCEELVIVYQPEALRIARWLMEPAQAEARDGFLARFPAWQKAVGDAPARLVELRAKGDGLGYLEAHRAQWRKRVMCAFNAGGDCTIYPVRPVNCRNAHAIETHTLCSGANTTDQPASRLAYQPIDDHLVAVDRILVRAQHAIGGERKKAQALCEAVHRLLQSMMAAERKAQRDR